MLTTVGSRLWISSDRLVTRSVACAGGLDTGSTNASATGMWRTAWRIERMLAIVAAPGIDHWAWGDAKYIDCGGPLPPMT